MIVMGTLGATNVLDQVFGKVSSSAAMQAYKPVLLIPANTEFVKPNKIMVGFDEELVDNGALAELIDFNRHFKAHVDFVHIYEKRGKPFHEIREELMERLLESEDVPFSFDIRQISVDEGHIPEQLQKYAEETNPDIQVVIAKHRSFVERLLHISTSRALCLHANRPLLILHTD